MVVLFRARLGLLTLLLACHPVWAAEATALYDLIGERLSLMRDVAAYKWLNGLPVRDAEREALVIDAAVAAGLRRGIRPAASRRLFEVQIRAAREIQQHWFERWQAGSGPGSAPDLGADVRPRLLRLGNAIVDACADPHLTHDQTAFLQAVEVPGLEPTTRLELYDALRGLSRYPDRLAQILDTGVLRVGTTGDYPPFSDSADGEVFQGIDIDLARDLADSLGVQLVLVPTSWPTLLDDLRAGAWDVGMSGISRTLPRARVGYLSAPYHVGGKLPVARCEDAGRFATLTAIDRPGVRVIVNPGGTNEAFVDARLTAVEKIVHADNRTIFEALVAGRADLMITDQIEVRLQTRRHPALCATMDGPLTYQEKGYLMPKDDPLSSYVDTWIELRRAENTVKYLTERHLEALARPPE